MDEIGKWMEKNAKLCVVTGIFGLLVSPFLWPFFLAILFQSLSLTAPIILAWLFIKRPWREKEEQHEKVYERMQHGKNADTGKLHPDDSQTDDLSQDGKEKRQEPLKEKPDHKKTEEPDEADCFAILWYQREGRERILRVRQKLEKEGKTEFSISRDGICSVRQEKGFQRVGVLRGYPGNKILAAATELKKDGLSIKAVGDYIWVSWGKGGTRHAL